MPTDYHGATHTGDATSYNPNEETLRAPLAALEELIPRAQGGSQQLNQAAQRSGLPKIPEPPP